MKYFDAVFLQVIGWAVALILAWAAKALPGVSRWLSAKPWRTPFFAAVLVSGLLNALALWIITSTTSSTIDAAITTQRTGLDTLKSNLRAWGGNQDTVEADNACADGYYVSAVGSKSVSGGGNGYLESVTIRCRPLNVQ